MKKALILFALFGVAVTQLACSCKKKEKTTKVVKAKKADAKEVAGYAMAK